MDLAAAHLCLWQSGRDPGTWWQMLASRDTGLETVNRALSLWYIYSQWFVYRVGRKFVGQANQYKKFFPGPLPQCGLILQVSPVADRTVQYRIQLIPVTPGILRDLKFFVRSCGQESRGLAMACGQLSARAAGLPLSEAHCLLTQLVG